MRTSETRYGMTGHQFSVVVGPAAGDKVMRAEEIGTAAGRAWREGKDVILHAKYNTKFTRSTMR